MSKNIIVERRRRAADALARVVRERAARHAADGDAQQLRGLVVESGDSSSWAQAQAGS